MSALINRRTLLFTVALWTATGALSATEVDAPVKAGRAQPAREEASDKAAKTPPKAADSASPRVDEGRRTATVWRAVVKVVNPAETREAVEKEARALGGFPMFFDGRSINVKIPPAALPAFAEKIAGMGLVLEKTMDREDVTLEMASLSGKLKSKREILERTRKFLDDSDVAATLEIERTMTGLVMEIEELSGALRVLQDRTAFAVADISFEFRERDKIVYMQSPFGWLNTVDLARFTREFQR